MYRAITRSTSSGEDYPSVATHQNNSAAGAVLARKVYLPLCIRLNIADCMDRIAPPTRGHHNQDVAESMLLALEESLRAVEKHRQYVIERLKDSEPS
jgi:hypothetical protein